MDILTFLRKVAAPLGLLGILSGMASHEYTQGEQIQSNTVQVLEQEKRVDRLESKMDKMLDKMDQQNEKIDDIKTTILKSR
jgi:uncharacterized coiled-coil protein SlyX